MSDDRRSPAPSNFESESPEPRVVSTRSRRSLWTAWRRLLWTSTVASACTSTRVQTAPIPDRLPSGQRGEIRVAMRSGDVRSIYDARVVQDSIIGFDRPASAPDPQRVAIARADVASVSTQQLSVGKTILAVVGGTFAALTLLVVAACSGM